MSTFGLSLEKSFHEDIHFSGFLFIDLMLFYLEWLGNCVYICMFSVVSHKLILFSHASIGYCLIPHRYFNTLDTIVMGVISLSRSRLLDVSARKLSIHVTRSIFLDPQGGVPARL